MESLESNDQLSPRPLTREEWYTWVSEYRDQDPYDTSFPRPSFARANFDSKAVRKNSDEIFERIVSSPTLQEKFLLWPESAQLSIARILVSDVEASTLAIRYSLREQLQTLHPDVMDWMSADDTHIMMFGHAYVAGDAPDDYIAIIDDFYDFQQSASPKSDVHTLDEIPALLIAIYGYPRVIDAMKLWMNHASMAKIEQFIQLIEKWDDFEYPREWMLNTFE